METKNFRICFITNGSQLGFSLLKEFQKRNITIHALLFDQGIKKKDWKRQASNLLINLLPCGALRILPFLQNLYVLKSRYKHYSKNVFFVSNINRPKSIKFLQKAKPSLLILGGSRIIRKPVIKTAKIGVLNAHPGLLPKYRGVDVIRWAIHEGDELGVTVHLVNDGVDTGEIIATKKYTISIGDTIETLKEKAEKISTKLMVDVVEKIVEEGKVETHPNKREEGKQYYKMPKALMKKVDLKLKQYAG